MQSKISRTEYWKNHINKEKIQNLSTLEYCRIEGLKASTFRYWKKKLSDKTVTPGLKSPFVKVSVAKEKIDLPNPEWVASLIRSLMKGES